MANFRLANVAKNFHWADKIVNYLLLLVRLSTKVANDESFTFMYHLISEGMTSEWHKMVLMYGG